MIKKYKFNYIMITIMFLCLIAFPIKLNAYFIEVIAENLNYPWSMVTLPNSDILITEKPGNIRIIRNGKLIQKNINGVPNVVFDGQGGLLDIVLHPNFDNNHWVYLSYSIKVITDKSYGIEEYKLTVTRFVLKNDTLTNPHQIFISHEFRDSPLHFGGRLLFISDNRLLITNGDGYSNKDSAQTLDNHFGKIICVNDDGTIPKNNPFLNNKNALPDIWSFGHRNPQGLVFDHNQGIIYSNEHGPKGGDELNIIEAKKNYGWPIITHGIDYNGEIISPYTQKKGMEQPVLYWTPSIALSSMAYYDKSMFPEWKNSLFITGLKSEDVRRIKVIKNTVIEKEILFKEINQRLLTGLQACW